MRESRLSGSVEGVMSDHDSYSDSFVRLAETLARCSLCKRFASQLDWGAYSVETVSDFSSRAASIVCQARVAHFTRTGNSETPEKTINLPMSAPSCASIAGLVTSR